MDLRVKRTTKNIKEAFLELRKKKNLDKISVKELSELAMINKATFYLHYRDIYELSDQLENELIDRIIAEIKPIAILNTRDSFRAFFRSLSMAIINNEEDIHILFSGYETNRFIDRFEARLKRFVFSAYPNIRNNSENNIFISFIVQGSFHAYARNNKIDKSMIVDKTTDLTLKLTEEFTA